MWLTEKDGKQEAYPEAGWGSKGKAFIHIEGRVFKRV